MSLRLPVKNWAKRNKQDWIYIEVDHLVEKPREILNEFYPPICLMISIMMLFIFVKLQVQVSGRVINSFGNVTMESRLGGHE